MNKHKRCSKSLSIWRETWKLCGRRNHKTYIYTTQLHEGRKLLGQ